jgi:DNA polymerase-3 subunit alpha
MDYIDQFIESKLNRAKIQYPLPDLKPILEETYGVIVYQEQVMEIARKIGGYSLGQADILRRAMGKKKLDVMAKQKEKFIKGAIENKYSEKDAEKIFELLIPFAGYGFNKSHAAAYSVLAYKTAYLKANYPAEFMAANLTNEIHNTDKLAEYIEEARGMGIEIRPPDINLSETDFTVVDGKIIYGLLGVRNAGGAVVDAIIEERQKGGTFKDIHDFLERVDLKVANRKVCETLIKAGVFNSLGENRATLFANLDKLLDAAHRKKEFSMYGQASLFESVEDSGIEEIAIERIAEYPQKQLLDWEKENLGFFFSGHPLDEFKKAIRKNTTLNLTNAGSASAEREYSIIGLLKNVKEIITKNGKKMAFGTIEDYNGSIELVIFSDIFEKYRDILVNEQVIAVRGKIDLSRGDPKFIVSSFNEVKNILDDGADEEKPAREVHILLSGNFYIKENLGKLKEFCASKKGTCSLFLHPENTGNGNGNGTYLKSSIKVPADEEFLEKLRHFPQVMKVWKE